MLWTQSFLGELGSRAPLDLSIPAVAAPFYGLDTSQRSTFFTDTAGTAVASDSASIARVNDAFGTGNMSFQASDVNNRPQIIPAVANNRAALRFAQGSFIKWMQGVGSNPALSFQTKSFTIALVYSRSSALEYAGVFNAGNGAGGNNGYGYDTLLLEGRNSSQEGNVRLIRAGGNDASIVRLNSPGYADNQVMKFVARSDPANGVEVRSRSASGSFSGTGALSTSADLFTWDTVALGCELGSYGQSLPLYPFFGDIFEFRFWSSRASNAQFDQMQSYLDAKYGS